MGSKTIKAFVHLINAVAFLWAQVAYTAASYDPVMTYKGMFQAAQTKRPKAVLLELFEQNKKDFPYEFKRELEYRMKKFNPELPAPELDVVNEGKNRIVRIHFRQGKNTTTVQINNRHDKFAEVVGSYNGKSFRHPISADEIGDPLKLLHKMTGKRRTITRKAPSIQLLSAKQIALLGEDEKKAYIDRVRATMELAEKTQNAFSGAPVKTSWNPFFESAWAAKPSGDCIVAGWPGSYSGGSCKYPQGETEKNGQRCMQCNPAIYADSCVPFNGNRVSSTATADCNRATERDKYKPFYGIKNQEEFDARMGELRGTIDDLQTKCTGIKEAAASGTPPKNKDQAPTCASFEGRLTELSNATCELLEKDQEKFKGLTCASKEPINDIPEEEEQDGGGELEPCGKQPKRVSCGSGQMLTMECRLPNGKTSTVAYCDCGGAEEVMRNTVYPVGCRSERQYEEPQERPRRDFDDDRERRRERRKPREESGFLGLGWQNWLAIALVVGVGYYAFTQIPKAQPWQTPNPQWPNPPVMWQAPASATGTGTTYPVNSTR